MTRQQSSRAILLLSISLLVLLLPLPVFAQSCALCYTQAASASARFIAALRSGIFILIVPPMFMSVGIAVLTYRKRNQFNDRGDLPNGR